MAHPPCVFPPLAQACLRYDALVLVLMCSNDVLREDCFFLFSFMSWCLNRPNPPFTEGESHPFTYKGGYVGYVYSLTRCRRCVPCTGTARQGGGREVGWVSRNVRFRQNGGPGGVRVGHESVGVFKLFAVVPLYSLGATLCHSNIGSPAKSGAMPECIRHDNDPVCTRFLPLGRGKRRTPLLLRARRLQSVSFSGTPSRAVCLVSHVTCPVRPCACIYRPSAGTRKRGDSGKGARQADAPYQACNSKARARAILTWSG